MYNMTVSAEEADDLVATVLMETFESLSRDILSLRLSPTLTRVGALDLADFLETREGVKTALKYFMVHEDFQDFMEMQRVYGFVE